MSYRSACRDIGQLHPLAQQACKLFMEECKRRNIPIFITETYRSQQRQNYLYEQGRTRPGNIVTWTRSSNHTGRMAWDIAVSPPRRLYDSATLAQAGKVAGELGIEWGGTWVRNLDTPHFQIDKNWKNPKREILKPEKTKFNLNGKNATIDGFIVEGKTYVIVRPLLEGLGHTIGWDNKKKAVVVNNKVLDFDYKIVDGRTYTIARPLLESLGWKVDWDGKSKTIYVRK